MNEVAVRNQYGHLKQPCGCCLSFSMSTCFSFPVCFCCTFPRRLLFVPQSS
jgi:hypothetical protein